MRGKPWTSDNTPTTIRNIPAYAGKTFINLKRNGIWEEHPRVCGENGNGDLGSLVKRGTSPRMRGKRRRGRHSSASTRNIPAYAGKTCCPAGWGYCRPEHPRVCGENALQTHTPRWGKGTSPRMRGKLRRRYPSRAGRRNIPAYAGKTVGVATNSNPDTEHPRVCGENIMKMPTDENIGGTSPRMRGKLSQYTDAMFIRRNIPAYAGKTTGCIRRRQPCPEHPRVCGENGLSVFVGGAGAGTSPRMRGKQTRATGQSHQTRNIPAYAGKTLSLPWCMP